MMVNVKKFFRRVLARLLLQFSIFCGGGKAWSVLRPGLFTCPLCIKFHLAIFPAKRDVCVDVVNRFGLLYVFGAS